MAKEYFETYFWCNSIALLASPAKGEDGTVRRLREDLETLCTAFDYQFLKHTVNTKAEFLQALDQIRNLAEQGTLPILHIDCHAHKSQGLQIGSTGEFVSWHELADTIRPINVATRNNLCLYITACYGYYSILPIVLEKPSPYFMVIAPPSPVSVKTIEERVIPFYRKVMSGEDVLVAVDALGPDFYYYHCEKMLLMGLYQYTKEQCIGSAGKKRVEQLAVRYMQRFGMADTRLNRRRVRKKAREHIKPTQAMVDKYAKTFLVGQPHNVTVGKVMRLLRRGL